jgi:FtsZ-interacting cell division protein ZipA
MGTKKLTYILSLALVLIIVPLLVFSQGGEREQAGVTNDEVVENKTETNTNNSKMDENSNSSAEPNGQVVEDKSNETSQSPTQTEENTSSSNSIDETNGNEIQSSSKEELNSSDEDQNTEVTKEQTDPPKKKEPKDTVTITVIGPDEHGIVIQGKKVTIKQGDTVLSVLLTASEGNGFKVEYTGSGSIAYIEGIDGVYEFDYGAKSGWLCFLNGVEMSKSAGTLEVKDGDVIEWKYTKDFGADL